MVITVVGLICISQLGFPWAGIDWQTYVSILSMALGLQGLTAALTIALILTDVLSCCPDKFKPTIKERSIKGLLGQPHEKSMDHSNEELEMDKLNQGGNF